MRITLELNLRTLLTARTSNEVVSKVSILLRQISKEFEIVTDKHLLITLVPNKKVTNLKKYLDKVEKKFRDLGPFWHSMELTLKRVKFEDKDLLDSKSLRKGKGR